MLETDLEATTDYVIRTATNADIPAVTEVIFAALVEYGLRPDPDGTDADLKDIEGNYLARRGAFEVVQLPDGRIVGSAGLLQITPRRAELRKMYLAKRWRGRGIGRRLLERMLAAARRLGYPEVFLQTNSVLVEAVKLYESAGFQVNNADLVSPRCDHAYLLRLP